MRLVFLLGMTPLFIVGPSLHASPDFVSDSLPNRGNVVSIRRDVRPWELKLVEPCLSEWASWEVTASEPRVFAYCRVRGLIPKDVENQGLELYEKGKRIQHTVSVGKYKVTVEAFMELSQLIRFDAWIFGYEYSSFSGSKEESAGAKQTFATAVQAAIAKWKADNASLVHYTVFYNTRNDFQFEGNVGDNPQSRLYSTFE
ncbi:MAG: hypothetical protein KDD51_02920 [Bdellovibrionales bacterium]|nr:hypothetical protein [Bdellovibrionales bacterium]